MAVMPPYVIPSLPIAVLRILFWSITAHRKIISAAKPRMNVAVTCPCVKCPNVPQDIQHRLYDTATSVQGRAVTSTIVKSKVRDQVYLLI